MKTQPIERLSILPTQVRPTLPAVGVNRTPLPKQRSTRAEAVRAAKAEITRREIFAKAAASYEGINPLGHLTSGVDFPIEMVKV